MSETILKAANQLLKDKKYSAARAILETISDNPTAKEWLVKLDTLDPIKKEDSSDKNALVDLLTKLIDLVEDKSAAYWEFCQISIAMPQIDIEDMPKSNDETTIWILTEYYSVGDVSYSDGHTIYDEKFNVPFGKRFQEADKFLKMIVADHGDTGYEVFSIQHDSLGRPIRFFLKRKLSKKEWLKKSP